MTKDNGKLIAGTFKFITGAAAATLIAYHCFKEPFSRDYEAAQGHSESAIKSSETVFWRDTTTLESPHIGTFVADSAHLKELNVDYASSGTCGCPQETTVNTYVGKGAQVDAINIDIRKSYER